MGVVARVVAKWVARNGVCGPRFGIASNRQAPRARRAKQGRAGAGRLVEAATTMSPLAYHLVWTTYGSWLHGDARGSIQSGLMGVQPPNPEREQQARDLMAEESVVLTPEQRAVVEQTIREHCRIRGWLVHAVNVRSNHVHVVVTCDCAAEKARDEFKLWSSRRLSDMAGLTTAVARKTGRRHWWTEGGHAEIIWNDRYFANAVEYVVNMQGD